MEVTDSEKKSKEGNSDKIGKFRRKKSYNLPQAAKIREYINILIRSNKMQLYAGIYLSQNYFTCFGCHRTHHQEHIKL